MFFCVQVCEDEPADVGEAGGPPRDQLQPGGPAPRTARHREDQPLPGPRPQARHPPRGPLRPRPAHRDQLTQPLLQVVL